MLSQNDKEILFTLVKILPELNSEEKRDLLKFGEGMAFMKKRQLQSVKNRKHEAVSDGVFKTEHREAR